MQTETRIYARPRPSVSLLSADESAKRDASEWRYATALAFPMAIHDESDGARILVIRHDGRADDFANVEWILSALSPAFETISASRVLSMR